MPSLAVGQRWVCKYTNIIVDIEWYDSTRGFTVMYTYRDGSTSRTDRVTREYIVSLGYRHYPQ